MKAGSIEEALRQPHRVTALTVFADSPLPLGPALMQLPRLRRLELGWLGTPALPHELASLPDLRELVVLNLPLYAFPAPVLSCRGLRKLAIRGCSLSAIPAELGNLRDLEALDLGANCIREVPPDRCAFHPAHESLGGTIVIAKHRDPRQRSGHDHAAVPGAPGRRPVGRAPRSGRIA